MSNPIKITVGPSGEMTVGVPGRSDAPKPEEQKQPAPSPQHKTGGIVTRYSSATGRMETIGPSGTHVVPAVGPSGLSVRSAAGMPTSLGVANPSDLITIPNLGETSIAAAVTMGYCQPRAGGGYELVPGVLDAVKPAADAPVEEKKDELPAGDVTGVEPTSEATDRTLKAIQDRTPQGLEGVITSLSTTGELPEALVADLARQHGTDAAEFRKSIDGVVADHVRAGNQVLKGVDASIDPASFQKWLLSQPELANTVTRDMMGKNVRSLQDAARTYSKNRSAALETALDAKGVETTHIDGTLFISRKSVGLEPTERRGDFGGSNWISVADAIRGGHLEVNG